jgi:hypothetical protein
MIEVLLNPQALSIAVFSGWEGTNAEWMFPKNQFEWY